MPVNKNVLSIVAAMLQKVARCEFRSTRTMDYLVMEVPRPDMTEAYISRVRSLPWISPISKILSGNSDIWPSLYKAKALAYNLCNNRKQEELRLMPQLGAEAPVYQELIYTNDLYYSANAITPIADFSAVRDVLDKAMYYAALPCDMLMVIIMHKPCVRAQYTCNSVFSGCAVDGNNYPFLHLSDSAFDSTMKILDRVAHDDRLASSASRDTRFAKLMTEADDLILDSDRAVELDLRADFNPRYTINQSELLTNAAYVSLGKEPEVCPDPRAVNSYGIDLGAAYENLAEALFRNKDNAPIMSLIAGE